MDAPRTNYGYVLTDKDAGEIFEEFIEAGVEKKKSLIIQNILKSVKCISKKGNIDYKLFESDIIRFCKKINLAI